MPGDGRQNCCRLCLAPDSECISILNSYAADKEPLTTKIQNCVHIKVTPDDGMSLRICHACISYLNSWQSFKNRCVAAQNKQKNWLEFSKRQHLGDNNVSISTISATSTTAHRQQHPQQQHQKHQPDQEQFSQEASLASSILDGITSLKKRRSLTVYPLPAIKDEPIDDDDDYDALKQPHDESDEMVVDPTMFLERHEEEGTEPFMTHVHSSIQDTSNYGYEPSHLAGTPAPDRTTIEVAAAAEVKEASCRACNLKFSTRANARRHERNLHPTLFELSSSANNSTLVTKPTAALAAALEMQRSTAGGSGVSDIVKKSFASFTSAGSSVGAASASQRVRPQFTDSNTTSDTGFDYDNPEKYRDLLTDEKIVFLQQNEEFLQQYQTMTCKCCRKFYVSYKNFMAHMRKKYVTLPRNVCFNCLKLNDSKALFISHLKRRNCINLYKVMHSLMARQPTFAAAVAATTAAMPEKLRAKELLVNKIYECKLCTKFFRLKLEFRSHVYDEHADAQKKDVSPGQCSFCGLEIEDPSERKRHYNNMDCIVTLRCVTCDDKFSNHQKFLDHVYARHLVQPLGGMEQRQRQQSTVSTGADIYAGKKQNASLFGGATSSADEFRSSSAQSHAAPKSQYFSRMPQACPICGQQYNNYNNVLRHMESKHPDQLPQTYKCVKCGNGYPRLSNLREHMLTVHSGAANNEKTRSTSFEYIVNADAVKTIDGSGGPNVSGGGGRYDYVMKDLMSITNGGTVEADEEDDSGHGQAMKKIRLDSTTNNSGTASAAGGGSSAPNSFKECPICNAIFSNNIGLSNHMRSHTAAAQNFAGPVPSAFRDTAHHGTDRPASSPATASAVPMSMQPKASAQFFKHSLKLAADRRFRRMRCRICQKRFSSKKSYRRHMLDDHQIRNVQFIKCKLCDAEFAYEKGLKVHMFKIHNTLLKDEMIIKQYECDICSIVYRTEEQLLQHKKSVHGNENAHPDDFTEMVAGAASAAGGSGGGNAAAAADIANVSNASQLDSAPAVSAPLYWYQCKYCPSNFNTNKKLAIHINSHDEFDSNDYSCKDCGNVYSGRKSLWVHRYKKHPQIAEPSECVLCRKVFFDSQMLENHIPTCNRKPITATGAVAELPTSSNSFFRHKTGDDEEDDGSRGRTAATRDGQGSSAAAALANLSTEDHSANSKLKIKLPEVACTICGQRFTDQELFTKHIQMHEMELYTDNPLAAMFDTGPADPNQFYLDRVNDNGEYVCDICTKAFTQMTALKVHRKWHFRGDSKQNPAEGDLSASTTSQTQSLPHPPGLQAVGLVPNPRPSKSLKRKRELKCEYCPSTFISNNNLRRHIYELHKSEIAHLPEPPKIKLDDNLHCRKCALKFETKKDWIDHKVADARLMKPYGPFQWGCEMCGEYVSRKEKLIHHIQSHMKEQIVVPAHLRKQQEEQRQQESTMASKNSIEDYGADSNSQDSQQTDENDVAAKNDEEQDYEEDDGGADYLVDEEEEQDEEDDDDEDDDVDDDDGGGYVDSSNVIKREQIHATKRADVDNGRKVENMDDNANDGQRGNDEYLEDDVDEEEEDDDLEEDDSDDMNDLEKRKLMGQSNTTNYVNASAVEDSMQSRNDDDVDEDDDDDDDDEDDEDEGDDEEDEEEEEEEEAADESVQRVNEYADDDVDDDDRDDVENHATSEKKSRFACDLCQVFFDTQLELQKHVKIHFLNGPGSVTLTEIRAKEVNTSRGRVDSDAMSVSSS